MCSLVAVEKADEITDVVCDSKRRGAAARCQRVFTRPFLAAGCKIRI
jgi:hypothetical protein